MDVAIAEERILVIADRIGPEEAEARAWARRIEAFGALARVTGLLARTLSITGSTFEQHLGKILEPKFLLDIGAEAANIFIPGATVAKLAIVKSLELHRHHKGAKAK
jgi:hypothetical protein